MRLAILAVALVLVGACQDSDVTREVGARCDTRDECDDRCLVPGADWPGGFCTIACNGDLDCPEGAACIEEEGGVCAFTCTTDPGCAFLGSGYGCHERLARGGDSNRFVCRGA